MLTEISREGSPKAAISPTHTRTHQRLRAQHISRTCLCHQMGAAGLCSFFFFVCVKARFLFSVRVCVCTRTSPQIYFRSLPGSTSFREENLGYREKISITFWLVFCYIACWFTCTAADLFNVWFFMSWKEKYFYHRTEAPGGSIERVANYYID